jgi:hypothetical protein
MPYLVLTVQPSTSGSRSRCTPSRETSRRPASRCGGDLVDLVDEHDAVLLGVASIACALDLVLVDQLGGLLVDQQLHGLADLQLARVLRLPPRCSETSLQLLAISSMPGGPHDVDAAGSGATSISISRRRAALAQHLAEFLPGVGAARRLGPTGPETRPSRARAAAAARRGCAPRRVLGAVAHRCSISCSRSSSPRRRPGRG